MKTEGQDSWQQYVEQLETSGKDSPNLITARSAFEQRLVENQPADALALDLKKMVKNSSSRLAQAEVGRLEGIAYLMLEQYEDSIKCLSSALELTKHPFMASHIGLLLGEAYRHSGDFENWKKSWHASIEVHSHLYQQQELNDPAYWKQAAFLRPADTPWPTSVISNLQAVLAANHLHFDPTQSANDESVVWAVIGRQSLMRRESQNAILAFKKSEALVSNRSLADELQMQQAIAMIDGGQPGPASAILYRISSQNTILADRAKAVLATLKLQNGSLTQGMNLLQTAIISSSQWPVSERLRAEADFGLALLMRDREEQGIQLLHQVHAEFLVQKNYEHAIQCLWNIAKYYEQTDQPGNQQATISKMKQLEDSL
jgi:tetratricopeptide (TPR) repeat protein